MDRTLVEAFRRGERAALERVYNEHVDGVERMIRAGLARARRFSAANLADLVQDVFLRAFSERARSSYDGKRAYGPYLATLTRNVLIDWLRRPSNDPSSGGTAEELVDLTTEPGQTELFEAELVATTASYVEKLSPELKRVHEERFVRASSQRSAAEALGISRQNMRTLERRLVDGLRRALSRARLTPGGRFDQPKRRSAS
jgi:RNA polymerase sigma-70 factor (ECF subfamily)